MANWSETNIRFIGENEEIKMAREVIEKNRDNGGINPNNGENWMEILTESYNENEIIISGAGRWSSPSEFFKNIAIDCDCNLKYTDAEPGSDYFILIEVNKNEINQFQDDYFCQAHIDTMNDMSYWINNFEYLVEEYTNDEDWYEDNRYIFELFEKNEYTIEDLKKEWGIIIDEQEEPYYDDDDNSGLEKAENNYEKRFED